MTNFPRRASFSCLLTLLLWTPVNPAKALNILLTNEDGFESASTHALYQKLKAAGHSVIVSAPAHDKSAVGGSIDTNPIGPLASASRGGTVAAGAPGVGSSATDPDVYYVNNTPVVSMLHGVDVAAKRKWGRVPDLVVAGVNYGLDTGSMHGFAATVGAAVAAMNRGIPAIAVSADYPSGTYRAVSELRPADREYEIADFVVELVQVLERTRAEAGALLPPRTGLNVNLPSFEPGKGAALPVRMAKVGVASAGGSSFVMSLANHPTPRRPNPPALPGLVRFPMESSEIEQPNDTDAGSEYNVIKSGAIAISVLESSYQSESSVGDPVTQRLSTLRTMSLPR